MGSNTPSKSTADLLLDENRRLKRAVEELSVLNDLAAAIGGSLDSREIIKTIIHRSLKALHAEQGVITLLDITADSGLKTLVRTVDGSSAQYHLQQQLAGWMQLHKQPLRIVDPAHDERFRGVQWEASIRSVICVPIMVKSNLRGVLTVYNRKDEAAFTEEDQRLLTIIASQSAQVLENARLYEGERLLLRMNEELRLAAEIQRNLLPTAPPSVDGYAISGITAPAQVVGGDYFDFFTIGSGQVGLCLGDVSGKGLPASLLMANVQATLRGQALFDTAPGECLQRSNRLLHHSTASDKFVTLFFAVLDFREHHLSFSNAGHERPFLISSGGAVRRLGTGGVVLSILEEYPYEDERVIMSAGDTLVVYSDGITEAANSHGELFGEERLGELLTRNHLLPPAELQKRILDEVRAYADNELQGDDRTLLIVQRC
jgi:phosphoserine phosphatase RsbU/P